MFLLFIMLPINSWRKKTNRPWTSLSYCRQIQATC